MGEVMSPNDTPQSKLHCSSIEFGFLLGLFSSRSFRLIIRPQDVILAPDLKGLMKEFCGQICLTSFNYKKTVTNFRKTAVAVKALQTVPQSLCSMCTRYCVVSQTEQDCR